MSDYLPVISDIEPELAELALGDDIEAVAERTGVAARKLQRLIQRDPEAVDMIQAARAEYAAFLAMYADLAGLEAVNTLRRAMNEELSDKKATAAVRAADSILDRTLLPKVTRQIGQQRQDQSTRALPDVTDLIEQAGSDEEAHQIADQYRELFRMADALKRGAKEVIDGSAV